MAAEASSLAARRRLDFSVDSTAALTGGLPEEPVLAVGVYVGEVVVRNAAGATWARSRDGDAGIGIGVELADPFGLVERERSKERSVSLAEVVAELLTYAEAPSDATAEVLGW